MKKPTIIYSIAAGLSLVGVVLSLLFSYKPMILEFKEGPGESETIENKDQAIDLLNHPALRGVDYYLRLQQGGEVDPNPSSISFDVSLESGSGFILDRNKTFIHVTMDENALLFQVNTNAEVEGRRIKGDYIVCINALGTMVKYNSYSATEIPVDENDVDAVLADGTIKSIKSNLGKWILLDLYDTRTLPEDLNEIEEDDVDTQILALSKMTADSLRQTITATISMMIEELQSMYQMADAHRDEFEYVYTIHNGDDYYNGDDEWQDKDEDYYDEDEDYYDEDEWEMEDDYNEEEREIQYNEYIMSYSYLELNFTNAKSPIITYNQPEMNIRWTFFYINNSIVEANYQPQLDAYDFIGNIFRELAEKDK